MEILSVRKMRDMNRKLAKSKCQKLSLEQSYRSKIAETAVEAIKDLRRKKSEVQLRTELYKSRLRKVRRGACLFASIVLTLFLVRLTSRLFPESDPSIKNRERALAKSLSGIVHESEVALRKDITVIALSTEGNRYYKSIISNIKKAVRGGSIGHINDFWAFSDVEYDPENGGDFSRCLSIALRKFPETGTLIVLSGGLIPLFEKSEELDKFLECKGHLVLVGDYRDGSFMEKIDTEERVSIVMKNRTDDNFDNNYRVFRSF